MTQHSAGEVSLSLSTSIYLIWLLPQLLHNHKRKSTTGLSFSFHCLLFVGYTFDLLYGFGLVMEWQYRLVSIVGLCSLLIQHIQFGYYNLPPAKLKHHYIIASAVILALTTFSIYTIIFIQHTQIFYIFCGVIANSCALLYLLPQILCNYKNKSTKGLSIWFIFLSILLANFDLASAYTLQWNWPSIVGPVFGLVLKLALLYQFYLYSVINQTSIIQKNGAVN